MSPLETLIRTEIRERDPMSFARFMELALYHPEWGYYARDQATKKVGRRGDFYTSVSVGSLFGRLLAKKFAQWWSALEEPDPFQLVECGGLDGQLAWDVLTALERDSPRCARVVQYILVEPLPRLAAIQKSKLAGTFRGTAPSNGPSKINWLEKVTQLKPVEGIIFGNELLDSFPVHRLEWKSAPSPNLGCWMECCIALEQDRLTWKHQTCPLSWAASFPDASGMTEYSLKSIQWLQEAAGVLKRGRILVLDYGWTDEEYFQVERPEGTLRGYRDHHLAHDLLGQPGEQDLTAHVRWTPLLEEAGRLGLQTEDFIQQGRWLSRIVAGNQLALTATEVRQFNALTHPEILGAPFRVLALAR